MFNRCYKDRKLSILATIALLTVNKVRRGTLDMTPSQRIVHQQSLLAAQIMEREKLLAEASTSDLEPSSEIYQ